MSPHLRSVTTCEDEAATSVPQLLTHELRRQLDGPLDYFLARQRHRLALLATRLVALMRAAEAAHASPFTAATRAANLTSCSVVHASAPG